MSVMRPLCVALCRNSVMHFLTILSFDVKDYKIRSVSTVALVCGFGVLRNNVNDKLRLFAGNDYVSLSRALSLASRMQYPCRCLKFRT